jgi:dTDP-4-dehydrorhamnose reductase
MKESVLITGGAGLLGLNWALSARSSRCVTLGLHSRRVALAGVNSRLLELESVNNLARDIEEIGPSVVVHAVALTNVEECECDRSLAQHVNVDLAVNVARACVKVGVPLIHISTDHLFSGEDSFVDEVCEPAPKNTYARTKADAERKVLELHPQSLIIRTNFYGWGPAYRQSFSDAIINSLREGREISLFGDVFYTPVLAESLVKTAHELLDTKASGIYHIVGDDRISKLEFGYRVAEEFGLDKSLIKPGSIADCPALAQRPRDMSLSNRKARDRLNRELGTVKSQIARLRELEGQRAAMKYCK